MTTIPFRSRKLLLLGALVCLCFSVGLAWQISATRQAPIRKPFLMQTRIEFFDAQGNLAKSAQNTEAVRSDGSSMHDFQMARDVGKHRSLREIYSAERREFVHFDPETRWKITKSASPVALRRETSPIPNDCIGANPGPGKVVCEETSETRFGFRLFRLRRTVENPAGQYESLLAKELNWKPVEYVVRRDGRITERHTAVSVIPGEPPADLFVVPPDVKEAPGLAAIHEAGEKHRGRAVPGEAMAAITAREQGAAR